MASLAVVVGVSLWGITRIQASDRMYEFDFWGVLHVLKDIRWGGRYYFLWNLKTEINHTNCKRKFKIAFDLLLL